MLQTLIIRSLLRVEGLISRERSGRHRQPGIVLYFKEANWEMMKSSAASPHHSGKQDAMTLLWHTTEMSALKTSRRIKCSSAGTNQYQNAEAPLCMFDPQNNQFSVTVPLQDYEGQYSLLEICSFLMGSVTLSCSEGDAQDCQLCVTQQLSDYNHCF